MKFLYVYNTALEPYTDAVGLQQKQQYPAIAAVSLVSYDVEARMKMFGWLNR